MKFRFWLNAITFIALGIMLIFAQADIVEVLRELETLNLWILLLMIPVQFMCFYAIAKVYQGYARAAKMKFDELKAFVSIAMEINFVLHVFPSAGVSAFSYMGFRMKEFGVSTAQASMLQLVRLTFAYITFIPLMIIGVMLLAFEDQANNFIILAASSLATLITFSTLALAYILGSRKRIHAAGMLIVQPLNRFIHLFRRNQPELIKLATVESTLHEFHIHYLEVRRRLRAMQPVIWWSLATNICELLLVYVVFMAHDAYINPGALTIAFAVANLASIVAFLPGGVGIYEPLMATILVSGGVPASTALSGILVYRVLGMFLSLPTGYFLYERALRRYGIARANRQ